MPRDRLSLRGPLEWLGMEGLRRRRERRHAGRCWQSEGTGMAARLFGPFRLYGSLHHGPPFCCGLGKGHRSAMAGIDVELWFRLQTPPKHCPFVQRHDV